MKKAIKESIHDRGDDNRNFFGQLREVRLSETVNNIAGKRLNEAGKSEDVVAAWKDAYRDLGYNLDVRYTTGEDTPEMKNKAGTAYVSKDGVHTIIININAEENSTKAGLIGTLAEEASHIVNGVAGRQIATGTEEKGLESTGRAANAYFQEEYKGSNQNMTYRSDGKIDTSKLGTNVGDACITIINGCMKEKGHISRAALGNPGFMNFINKVSQAVPKVVSFAVDFSPAGTLKGGIEAVTGKDMLTGEEVNLLSRVLGALPFVKPAYRGAKTTIKIVKSSKKAEVVLSDSSKIALKSDEVVKFEKQAKEAKIKNKGNSSKPSTEMIVRRGHFNGEYKPSPKHKGPKMPPNASPDSIPDIKTGNEVLKNHSYNSATQKQRFAIYKGKMIIFQPTGTKNEWHAYEITENLRKHVPNDTLKQMLKDGKITKVQYNKNRMK